jgi:hypothetical protein
MAGISRRMRSNLTKYSKEQLFNQGGQKMFSIFISLEFSYLMRIRKNASDRCW